MTIYLSDLAFYAYHGLYDEEKQIGGHYKVNVELTLHAPPQPIRQLDETVDYVEAYERIKARMAQPTELVETIAMELADQLLDLSDKVESVMVNIRKYTLPIPGWEGHTAVTFHKSK